MNWDYDLDVVYYLKATPYYNGKTGTPLEISFTLIKSPPATDAAVVSFSLIDAASNKVLVHSISNKAEIDISKFGTHRLNVRANTTGGPIGSVRFDLNGKVNYRTENEVPYALAGDNDGNYLKWPYDVRTANTLTATPYEYTNAAGKAGTPLTIHLYYCRIE